MSQAAAGRSLTATLANVASSATSVTLFAESQVAKARYVFNDSTAVLYIKFGTTASSSSYTVQLAAGAFYEFPVNPLYVGRVDAIWAAANGNARTSELT